MATNTDTDNDRLENEFQRRIQASRNVLETIPVTNQHQGNIPNTPAASAAIAFCLGGLFSLSLYTAAVEPYNGLRIPCQLGIYLAAWAFFHWAEFFVTASWNRSKCSVDCKSSSVFFHIFIPHFDKAYLLENGLMYHLAHSAAIIEYLVSSYYWPSSKTYPYVSNIGIGLIIFGQILRSAAMIHASSNFSHAVAFYKLEGHRLVVDGVYRWVLNSHFCIYTHHVSTSWSRHPSYTGFFYWGLGTQLLLQNPLSFGFFVVALWRFFYYRIIGQYFKCMKPTTSVYDYVYSGGESAGQIFWRRIQDLSAACWDKDSIHTVIAYFVF